jgi:membrane associated rhomboid family serine protease
MSSTRRRVKAVPALLALNVLVFLHQITLASPHFDRTYALSAAGLQAGHWWQLVTHAFLHGNELHLLFNMLGLWFAGRIVERVMGTGRFLALYLLAAVTGGIFQMALGGNGLLVGASGAVFGVMVAFASLFPESQVVALVFFIPVKLRAKYLGWGLAGSSLFLLLTGFLPGIGHAAHLGGCVAGYLFVRWGGRKPASTPTIHSGYAQEADHRNLHRNPN